MGCFGKTVWVVGIVEVVGVGGVVCRKWSGYWGGLESGWGCWGELYKGVGVVWVVWVKWLGLLG